MYFVLGDYVVGMLIGALTALSVRVAVWPGMDMVIAMLLGMAVGMIIHLVLGLLLAPVLGMFYTMAPGDRHVRRDALWREHQKVGEVGNYVG